MTDAGRGAAERWLRDRGEDVPEPILVAMLRLLESLDGAPESVAERFAEAGLGGLHEVMAGPGARSSANQLLAADALLTYAVEAAAEQGLDPLRSLLESLDIQRFEALTPGPVAEG